MQLLKLDAKFECSSETINSLKAFIATLDDSDFGVIVKYIFCEFFDEAAQTLTMVDHDPIGIGLNVDIEKMSEQLCEHLITVIPEIEFKIVLSTASSATFDGDSHFCKTYLSRKKGADLEIGYGTREIHTLPLETKEQDDLFIYGVSSDHAYIRKYIGVQPSVTVPSYIDGLPITIIGAYSFADSEVLEEIILPETICQIERGAFSRTEHLRSISLSSPLEKIGADAFDIYSDSLQSITLSPSVSKFNLGKHIHHADQITLCAPGIMLSSIAPSVWRGNAVQGFFALLKQGYQFDPAIRADYKKYISKNILYYVKTSETNEDIKNFLLSEGLYAENSSTESEKVWKTEAKSDGSLVIKGYKGARAIVSIPESIGRKKVTEIGARAFSPLAPRKTAAEKSVLQSIQEIHIPKTVKVINSQAFDGCSALSIIILPNSIKQIGYEAFHNCTSLERIILPNSVKELQGGAFSGCDNLREVVLSEGITSLPSQVFRNCDNLEYVHFSEKTESISIFEFGGCKRVTICGRPGSHAEEYAMQNGIPFKAE